MPAVASKETALLVIDIQHGLFEHKSPIYNADHLLQTINNLIDRAHQADMPVVFFQHINKGILKKNVPGWKLHPDLKTCETDTFMEKKHGSAFQDTLLDDWLRSHGITTLIMCGLTTHGCIKATCKDGLKNGYHVFLAADAHSSYHADAASLIEQWNTRLGQQGAVVIPAETFLFRSEFGKSKT